MIAQLVFFAVVLALSWAWPAPDGGRRRVEESWTRLRVRSAWSRSFAARVRGWEGEALRPTLLAAEAALGLAAMAFLPWTATGLLGLAGLQLLCHKGWFSGLFDDRAQQLSLELHLAVYGLLRGMSSSFCTDVKDFAAEACCKAQDQLQVQLSDLAREHLQLERGRAEAARRVDAVRQALAALREESVCGRCLLSSHPRVTRLSPRSYSDRDYSAKKHLTLSSGPSTALSALPMHFSAPCRRNCLQRVLRVWTRRFLQLR